MGGFRRAVREVLQGPDHFPPLNTRGPGGNMYAARVADFSMTFLGTGTAVGVPVIGCDCAVCGSEDERNKRSRSSVVVRAGDVTVLVDSGPDLRQQALRENLREIDAVIYTHGHL